MLAVSTGQAQGGMTAALASGGAALAVSPVRRGVELLRRGGEFGPLGRGWIVDCAGRGVDSAVGPRVQEQLRVCSLNSPSDVAPEEP